MRGVVIALLVVIGPLAGGRAAAVEGPTAEPEGADLAPASGWQTTGRFGLFTTSVTTSNANTSRDPEVQSSTRSARAIGTLDSTLWWRSEGPDEIEQRLQARYGRSRSGGDGWVETADLIEYDGVFRHRYQPRKALYAALTGTSAFTGPAPWYDPLDPIRASVSAGHSWLRENILPLSDRLEMRAGVRAQKRWGRSIHDYARRIEVGPETWIRYERKQSADLSWWVQAELFDEFSDPGHVQGLATAALRLQLTRLISVDLRMRCYYERQPRDLPASEPETGYDQIGMRQETLIGVNVVW